MPRSVDPLGPVVVVAGRLAVTLGVEHGTPILGGQAFAQLG